ncbi:F0F1 ATP synthase subunit I [Serratia rhizosphaerae]|uniref:F0F1 ATP synthase subunit I n=1 Tax=unclassified Serratia (in: enterobacteria) TaxID=2647522 RepID=UPI000CF5DBC7|nr:MULTISPECIES: F0F1 ATP synthase subunit I [unclassified Serratia (in: enterobacteria)]MBU3892915.1 F0F1 ATP synthase subunit I [Serratia rubidaea]AVJ19909.1 F0F1 ATP synthase subunit I [Serratia sp. MYb239]MCA4824893.1 F0F1 ATP synthase subunit I [Serratia rubidaea]QNK32482.1 F0F1 ATP synthase subunit I [Serratia sp. JUb9]QPT12769.1 F0F1 ATP synthase subunit I [Serratia rubidaea]
MSVSLYSGKVARKLLFLQFMTFVLISAAFGFKGLAWGVSALAGGLAAWLPSVMFMLFALRHQAQTPAPGRVAWSFAIGEGLKVVITIFLLIVALGVFKAEFMPLGLTYLAVLVVQIVAPAVINSYRT